MRRFSRGCFPSSAPACAIWTRALGSTSSVVSSVGVADASSPAAAGKLITPKQRTKAAALGICARLPPGPATTHDGGGPHTAQVHGAFGLGQAADAVTGEPTRALVVRDPDQLASSAEPAALRSSPSPLLRYVAGEFLASAPSGNTDTDERTESMWQHPPSRAAAIESALRWASTLQQSCADDLPVSVRSRGAIHRRCEDAATNEDDDELESSLSLVLTEDQQAAMRLIAAGLNVYVGGNAGTGKTALLRHAAAYLRHEKGLAVGLTATTGVAAATLGGCTMHALLQPLRDLSGYDAKVLACLDVLILDEVSLLDAIAIDALDRSARHARRCADRPFGGLQVIFSGDFLQLRLSGVRTTTAASVREKARRRVESLRRKWQKEDDRVPTTKASAPGDAIVPLHAGVDDGALGPPPQVFEAAVFMKHIVPCLLTHRHRQSSDTGFAEALDTLRLGGFVSSLKSRVVRFETAEQVFERLGIASNKGKRGGGGGGGDAAADRRIPAEEVPKDAVWLFPTRAAADEHNRERLRELIDAAAEDAGDDDEPQTGTNVRNFTAIVAPLPPNEKRTTQTLTFEVAHKRKTRGTSDAAIRRAVDAAVRKAAVSRAPSAAGLRSAAPEVHVFRCATLGSAGFATAGTDILGKSQYRVRAHIPGADLEQRNAADKALRSTIRSGALLERSAAKPHRRTSADATVPTKKVRRPPGNPLELHAVKEASIATEVAYWRNTLASPRAALKLPPDVRGEIEAATAERVQLCIGCRVMLLHNLSHSLVNGSMGTVVRFDPYDPIKLPAGMRSTVHVSDGAEVLPSRASCPPASAQLLPVVRFEHLGRAGAVEEAQIPFVVRRVAPRASMHGFGACIATLPLALAYGFTVHKVQGVTLSGPVVIDLRRMWPCEHLLYVACSRVRELRQLYLTIADPRLVMVNEKARSAVGRLQPAVQVAEEFEKSFTKSAALHPLNAAAFGFWKEHESGTAPPAGACVPLADFSRPGMTNKRNNNKAATKRGKRDKKKPSPEMPSCPKKLMTATDVRGAVLRPRATTSPLKIAPTAKALAAPVSAGKRQKGITVVGSGDRISPQAPRRRSPSK